MSASARILVVDDEPSLRQMMDVLLRRMGHDVVKASSVFEAREQVDASPAPFDLVVTDLMMADGTGLEVLDYALARSTETQVLVVTAHGSVETAVDAMRRGAYCYLEKPLSMGEARVQIEKALEKRWLLKDNSSLRIITRGLTPEGGNGSLIGRSGTFQAAMEFVRRAAPNRANVLITGESGTGKELFARAIHTGSDRSAGPFVVVNCGAIPTELFESELFGHEKGAYTGASSRTLGMFRQADGGTLFLDEVGEIPLHLQVKLLRALQERKVRSVGGTAEIPVDTRIVAATNRDLAEMVREKLFREDLFYRLNVLRLQLPPLRERREDLPALIEHFRSRFASENGRSFVTFSSEALRLMLGVPVARQRARTRERRRARRDPRAGHHRASRRPSSRGPRRAQRTAVGRGAAARGHRPRERPRRDRAEPHPAGPRARQGRPHTRRDAPWTHLPFVPLPLAEARDVVRRRRRRRRRWR